jgi:hypothetical protein
MALVEDLRTNAPQVRVAFVMAGHVGTDILANDARVRANPEAAYDYEEMFGDLIAEARRGAR